MSDLFERIIIIGGTGQLGSDLCATFADFAPAAPDSKTVDIERPSAIGAMLARFRPTLVINTSAFHNVEHCETRADRAFAINTIAVENLATQCSAAGSAFAHISTDYVFDGLAREPYTEDAPTEPINVYGISKLAGELVIKRRTERYFIFRTSGLYGLRGTSNKGVTFIERMLSQAAAGKPLRVVDDTTFSPSFTVHVARAIRSILERGAFGTYHVTNAGACSWYDFAETIFREAGVTADLSPVSSATFPSYARRPAYSALRHGAIERLGLPEIPAWALGVREYLGARAAAKPTV
jgi:dTDP-4-dehydrorhamnose reductase